MSVFYINLFANTILSVYVYTCGCGCLLSNYLDFEVSFLKTDKNGINCGFVFLETDCCIIVSMCTEG